MTDSDFLLRILEDNKPHSTNALLQASQAERGVGLMVHSRVADLRKRGHVITCNLVGRRNGRPIYEYQLLGSLVEASDQSTAESLSTADGDSLHGSREDGGRLDVSTSEPEPLFTFPRSPEWV